MPTAALNTISASPPVTGNTFASVARTALQSASSATKAILSPFFMPLPSTVTTRRAPANRLFTLFTASMPTTFMLKLYTGVHASS